MYKKASSHPLSLQQNQAPMHTIIICGQQLLHPNTQTRMYQVYICFLYNNCSREPNRERGSEKKCEKVRGSERK